MELYSYYIFPDQSAIKSPRQKCNPLQTERQYSANNPVHTAKYILFS